MAADSTTLGPSLGLSIQSDDGGDHRECRHWAGEINAIRQGGSDTLNRPLMVVDEYVGRKCVYAERAEGGELERGVSE